MTMQRAASTLLAVLCSMGAPGAAIAQQPTQPGWPQPIVSDAAYSYNLLDQLEARTGNGNTSFRWDAQGWYGTNYNRFWYKTEGETNGALTEEAELQALYAHPISRYFNLQAGVRYDFKPSPSRGWAAFGIQGLAPQWFDVEATGFVSDSGNYAARLQAEYDLLFTQRLILQPEAEMNFYSKSDRARGVGAGLSDIDIGLRLRYAIRREFAPYIGIAYEQQYGTTASFAREAGKSAGGVRFVVGIRAWF